MRRFLNKNRQLYFDAQAAADPKIAVVWAGEGIDSIFDIKEASELVREISHSAERNIAIGLKRNNLE